MEHKDPLGVILAGGQSRRFGAPKALAEVDGKRMIERVCDALREALPEVVLITRQPEAYADLGLPARADLLPGGALAGVHTGLRWAEELGRRGAICVACDMPFLSAALVRCLSARATESLAPVVAPESMGPAGIEPLCAFYSVALMPEIEARIARGERALTALLDPLHTERLPLVEVLRLGDPDLLFLNVNTPEDYRRALRLARALEEANAAI
ncbi:MAG TPA: molybdenum cofactor guanylyltransferase [Longimicrobiaceae bacterium]|nr:molybdenum cofactor guanylyltransferase [Longimicrobiaceae bacterium]